MNYLAHTLLSGNNENLIIGNFLMDMISRNEQKEINERFNTGFNLHFAIDEYTDEHESVKRITKLLRQNHHKYAPVVSDILMDYILGQNWESYSNEPIQKFADIRYSVISEHINEFPVRVRPIVAKMIDGNFLVRYTTIEGLRFTFEKIQEAARFKADFIQAIDDLETHYNSLNLEFNNFFPDLMQFTEKHRIG
jgi:acyl carrier protein phosphodiesterase